MEKNAGYTLNTNFRVEQRCHSLMEKFGISPSFHAESLFILRSLDDYFFPFKEGLTHQRLIREGSVPCKVGCGVGFELCCDEGT